MGDDWTSNGVRYSADFKAKPFQDTRQMDDDWSGSDGRGSSGGESGGGRSGDSADSRANPIQETRQAEDDWSSSGGGSANSSSEHPTWIAKIETMAKRLRDIEDQLELKKLYHATVVQCVEQLKHKAMRERNETVRHLCWMQVRAAELRIASAAGDHQRVRQLRAIDVYRKDKVVDDQTLADGVVRGK